MEVSFFVGIEALQKLFPELNGTEAQILTLFDDIREQIHGVASKIYARGRPGIYAFDLAANDF
jgi:hypothetical protein